MAVTKNVDEATKLVR